MPKSPLQKSIQDYLSKMKKPPSSHIHLPTKSLSLTTKRFIRGCKQPKTNSFSLENNHKDETRNKSQNDKAATMVDVDRFLFENFKSLYIKDEEGDEEEKNQKVSRDQSPRFVEPPPNLCGPHRFFVPTGSSSSLMEEPRTSATTFEDGASSSTTTTTTTTATTSANTRNDSKQVMGPEDFITLLTYSPSPYDDFKQSMHEMVEARLHHHGTVNWEFMEELLSCYMNLNDKKSYKYILSAFVDLVVALRENSGKFKAGLIGKQSEKVKRECNVRI